MPTTKNKLESDKPEVRMRPLRDSYNVRDHAKSESTGGSYSTGSKAKAAANKKYASSSKDSGTLEEMLKRREKK